MNWGLVAGGVAEGIPVGAKLVDDYNKDRRANEELDLRKAQEARSAEAHRVSMADIAAGQQAEIMAAGGMPATAASGAAPPAGLPVSRASAVAGEAPAAASAAEMPTRTEGSVTTNSDQVGPAIEPPRDAAPAPAAGGKGLTLAEARAATKIRERQMKEREAASLEKYRGAQANQANAQAARLAEQTRQEKELWPTRRDAAKLAYTEDVVKASMAAANRAYESAQASARFAEKYADDASLADPAVKESIKSTVDDLVRFHKSTADGKSVKVMETKDGYKVDEIDDITGKVLSSRVATTVGDVRQQLMVAGEIAKTENFPKYLASVKSTKLMADLNQAKLSNDLTKAENAGKAQTIVAELMKFTPEQLLDPEIQAKARTMANEAYQLAPDIFGEKQKVNKLDENGKVIETRDVQRNGLLSVLAMRSPTIEVETTNPKTGKTGTVSAPALAASAVNQADEIIKKAGGLANVQPYLEREMIASKLPASTAKYYSQQAARQIVQQRAQQMQQRATPAAMAPAAPAGPNEYAPGPVGRALGISGPFRDLTQPRPTALPYEPR